MKKIIKSIAVLSLICLLSIGVFAKEKSKKVVFHNDVTVNGTTVKKGTYKVVYDETTKEVSIFNDKDLVVKSAITISPQTSEVKRSFLATKQDGDTRILTGIALEGEKEMVIIDDQANKLAKPQ